MTAMAEKRVILPGLTSDFWPLTWLSGRHVFAHRHCAGQFFPTAAEPKIASARIIVRHQNDRPLNSHLAQPSETFLHQTFSQAESLIPRINRQVINMPAPAIMPAKRNTDDC